MVSAVLIIDLINSPNYYPLVRLFRTLRLSWDFVSSRIIMLPSSLVATLQRLDFSGGLCL
jgi:hypothetical protein